eukprot:tig00000741_g3841.t1
MTEVASVAPLERCFDHAALSNPNKHKKTQSFENPAANWRQVSLETLFAAAGNAIMPAPPPIPAAAVLHNLSSSILECHASCEFRKEVMFGDPQQGPAQENGPSSSASSEAGSDPNTPQKNRLKAQHRRIASEPPPYFTQKVMAAAASIAAATGGPPVADCTSKPPPFAPAMRAAFGLPPPMFDGLLGLPPPWGIFPPQLVQWAEIAYFAAISHQFPMKASEQAPPPQTPPVGCKMSPRQALHSNLSIADLIRQGFSLESESDAPPVPEQPAPAASAPATAPAANPAPAASPALAPVPAPEAQPAQTPTEGDRRGSLNPFLSSSSVQPAAASAPGVAARAVQPAEQQPPQPQPQPAATLSPTLSAAPMPTSNASSPLARSGSSSSTVSGASLPSLASASSASTSTSAGSGGESASPLPSPAVKPAPAPPVPAATAAPAPASAALSAPAAPGQVQILRRSGAPPGLSSPGMRRVQSECELSRVDEGSDEMTSYMCKVAPEKDQLAAIVQQQQMELERRNSERQRRLREILGASSPSSTPIPPPFLILPRPTATTSPAPVSPAPAAGGGLAPPAAEESSASSSSSSLAASPVKSFHRRGYSMS